jgi:hypothetical protein
MGVRAFDRNFVNHSRTLLESIPPDIRPQWGRMTPGQMRAHMVTAVRYSLGKEQETPNEGGLFGRLVAPLILGGIIKIPKGQKGPAMYDTAAPSATTQELVAELDAFLSASQKSGFAPPAHPYFGDIGARGWAQLHIVHLEHHLRQFGAATSGYVRG